MQVTFEFTVFNIKFSIYVDKKTDRDDDDGLTLYMFSLLSTDKESVVCLVCCQLMMRNTVEAMMQKK